jgi:hypothetical protein
LFGLNSPGCPERAADQRVRLAHPFFPNSIVNQQFQALRRVQRQPLTVLIHHYFVKTSHRIHDDFFSRFPIENLRESTARFDQN